MPETILTPPLPDSTESNALGAGTPPAPPAETPPAIPPGTPPAPPETPPKTPPAGPPEKYDFKMPDGVQVDQSLIDAATPIFKDLKLTQEQAQKLVDLQVKSAQGWGEKQIQEHQALVTSWGEESKKDTEFGGQGFAQNVAIAIKPLNQYGTPALRELLDATGLGNHPELIRYNYRIGKATGEPGLVDGNPNPPPSSGDARILYPNSKMNP